MPKPRIQSRVDPSQKDRIEDYSEEQGMTQAEAVRYLTFRGLDAEQEGGETEASDTSPRALVATAVAFMGLAVADLVAVVLWGASITSPLVAAGVLIAHLVFLPLSGLALVILFAPVLDTWLETRGESAPAPGDAADA